MYTVCSFKIRFGQCATYHRSLKCLKHTLQTNMSLKSNLKPNSGPNLVLEKKPIPHSTSSWSKCMLNVMTLPPEGSLPRHPTISVCRFIELHWCQHVSAALYVSKDHSSLVEDEDDSVASQSDNHSEDFRKNNYKKRKSLKHSQQDTQEMRGGVWFRKGSKYLIFLIQVQAFALVFKMYLIHNLYYLFVSLYSEVWANGKDQWVHWEMGQLTLQQCVEC